MEAVAVVFDIRVEIEGLTSFEELKRVIEEAFKGKVYEVSLLNVD